MKTLKYILSTFLVISVMWSCTENELNSLDFTKSAVAPTNVDALFTITQDNTGMVTIYPTAESAATFEIEFGDGNMTESAIQAGQSVVNKYAEGTYTVNITAIGITGLETVISKEIVVSFNKPMFGTDPIIENDKAISLLVNVTVPNDTEWAVSFDAYFVENGVETIYTGNVGGTVSHQYTGPGLVDIKVVLKGGAIETTEYVLTDFEVTEILEPLEPAPAPGYIADIDYISIFSDAYTDVEGTDFYPWWWQATTYAEFDLDGDKMLQYSNLNYQGIQYGETIDASSMEYVHFDVWTTDLTGLEFTLISVSSGEKFVIKELVLEEWNSFDIPLSEFTDQGLTINDLHQFKLAGSPYVGEGFGTIFLDNLYFWKEPSAVGGPILYDDFDGNGNITTWAGDDCGIDIAFANPYIDGTNGSATVLEYNDTGGQYGNIRFDAPFNLDLATTSIFSLKIYVPSSSITGGSPNQISLKLQDGTFGNPWETQTEIIKPIVLDQWQTITFDFASDAYVNWWSIAEAPIDRTDLNRAVLQINSENNNDLVTAYIDDFMYGTVAVVDSPPFAVDDFEGSGNITTWFGDDCGIDTAFANPYIDGTNGSATVLEYNDTGGQYGNVRFDVTPNFDLTAKSKFTLKIYVPSSSITGGSPNQISLKLQDGTFGNPWETQTEIIKPIVLDQWQEITFDFATDTYVNWWSITDAPIDRTDLNRVVLQINAENNNDLVTAYIDDFNYHN